MPFQIAFERRILTGPEFRAVEPSHHPMLKTLSRDKLGSVAKALRAYHDKARDQLRQHKRGPRGKSGAMAARSAPGKETTSKKHLVLADALKRVTARMAVLDADAKRKRTTAVLKDALAKKNARTVSHPKPGRTAGKGMAKVTSTKGRTKVNPGRIGSVSQQGKRAQARRDGR
jgi:hypothetical protein